MCVHIVFFCIKKNGVHLKAHTFVVQQGLFFLSVFSCSFDDQMSQTFPRFVILCKICWDTPSENTGLQYPNMSSAFKDKKNVPWIGSKSKVHVDEKNM